MVDITKYLLIPDATLKTWGSLRPHVIISQQDGSSGKADTETTHTILGAPPFENLSPLEQFCTSQLELSLQG